MLRLVFPSMRRPAEAELSTTTLPAGAVRVLPVPGLVRSVSGTLWLTVDGDLADIVLEPGKSRRFERGQRVLAYALGGAATYTIDGDAPAPAPAVSPAPPAARSVPAGAATTAAGARA